MNQTTCPISGQSKLEERFNTITHLVGLLLSLVGFTYLLSISFELENRSALISSSIYGTTLVLLYAASTYYHCCQTLEKKRILKIFDHVCIYLLIAGSYTPFTLGPLRDFGGWNLMITVWSIAFVGILLKVIAIHKFQLISLLAYLVMGWLVIFSFDTLSKQISTHALTWLIAGGLSYTIGILFYIWDKLPYNHGIWHLFVLTGSLCHYFCILLIMDNAF